MKNNLNTENIKYIHDKKHLQKGLYSSQYFLKTKTILQHQTPIQSVLQFTILNEGQYVVAGVGECVNLLKKVLPKKILKRLKIYGRRDGELITGPTGLLYIEGEYKDFCYFENIIDGILNKRIGIATRAYELKKLLTKQQEIIFMADRNDDYLNQPGNGLAAYFGGIKKFSTKEHIIYSQQIDNHVEAIGTMPHALIQQFAGDLYKATQEYIKYYQETGVTVLLDYNNDVIVSLQQIKPLLSQINGVRLDTSKRLVDNSLQHTNANHGVNPKLVANVKKWLLSNNASHIKIIVSSGIDAKKIQEFNSHEIKPDIFGIGGYFLTLNLNITADLVLLNGKDQAKYGRKCLIDYKHLLKCYHQ